MQYKVYSLLTKMKMLNVSRLGLPFQGWLYTWTKAIINLFSKAYNHFYLVHVINTTRIIMSDKVKLKNLNLDYLIIFCKLIKMRSQMGVNLTGRLPHYCSALDNFFNIPQQIHQNWCNLSFIAMKNLPKCFTYFSNLIP